MSPRHPLPVEFSSRPFRVSDARHVVSAKRLRARDLHAPFWGVRDPAGAADARGGNERGGNKRGERARSGSARGENARGEIARGENARGEIWGESASDFERRCRALATRMPPGSVFSHSTAARLHGIPLPIDHRRDPLLHVASCAPMRAIRVVGTRGHQLRLSAEQRGDLRGLPVTSPARTWCDLAVTLTKRDLVAAADFLIARRQPLCSIEELDAALRTRRGSAGVARLAEALPLLSERSESPAESVLRIILVEAGMPELDVNVDLRSAEGAFIARPDLRFAEFKLVAEYEGDGHRTDYRQWRKDIVRTRRLQTAGEAVIRVCADDLRDESALIRDISHALRERGWSGLATPTLG